jgi:hypothetical protein
MEDELLNLDETFKRCEFNHADYVLTVYFFSGMYITVAMNKSTIDTSRVSPDFYGLSLSSDTSYYNVPESDMEQNSVAEMLTDLLTDKQITAIKVRCERECAQIAFGLVKFSFFYRHSGYDAAPVRFEQKHLCNNRFRRILLQGTLLKKKKQNKKKKKKN